MNSEELAKYIEAIDGLSKPWLLVQLRLKKLEEQKDSITPEDYLQKIEEIRGDLIKLGEWWKGREEDVFKRGR